MFNRRKKRNSNKLLIILSIVAVLCILLFYSLWTLRYVVWQLDELGDVVTTMADDFNNTSSDLKSDKLLVSIAIIDDIRSQLNKLGYIRLFPVIRNVYYDARDVFDQAEQIFFNIKTLNEELAPIYGSNLNNKSITSYLLTVDKEELNRKLNIISTILKNTEGNLQVLGDDVDRLGNSFLLNKQKENLLKLSLGVKEFKSVIGRLNELLKIGPSLLGYPDSATYLLLLQNDHEMRATGGFIGNYGILTINNGKLENIYIDDIYHLDSEVIGSLEMEPPAPIRKYLGVQYWYMRDSNWSPDFPTAAAKAIEFYKLEGGIEKIDGVIAISPNVISALLDVTGEIIISNVLYESENFTNILQYEVEQNYEARGATNWERKEIIGELANVLANEVSNLPLDKMFSVIDIVYDNLESRELQIYSLDENTQSYLIEKNWAGELHFVNNDFLMVVDSNMAAFKTNQYINRSVDYFIQEISNPVGDNYNIATVKINYNHTGDFSWDTTRYRTYTRIYVPIGSVLINWSGAMENDRSSEPGAIDVYMEKDKTVFGAFIAVEPGDSGELILQYRLPDYVMNNYTFYYQMQAGMKDNLSVSLFNNKKINLEVKSDIEMRP